MLQLKQPEQESRQAAKQGLTRRILLWVTGAGAVAAAVPGAAGADQSAQGYGAPLVEINVPAGILTAEQKNDMIKGVTEVIVNALKLPPAQHRALWVLILETVPNGWGVAGQPIAAANSGASKP